MIKKLKRLGLALVLTTMSITTTPQNTYAKVYIQNTINISSQWAKLEIDKAMERDIVPEKIQGDYRRNITREEFSELAVRLYETLSKKEITPQSQSPFSDTNNPYITMANKLGIVDGKGDGTFAPKER